MWLIIEEIIDGLKFLGECFVGAFLLLAAFCVPLIGPVLGMFGILVMAVWTGLRCGEMKAHHLQRVAERARKHELEAAGKIKEQGQTRPMTRIEQ